MSTEVDKNQTIEESAEITHPESLSVWGLAWPSILSNLLFATVGLVAIKAVGSLGAEAVAAVGTGQRIFWVFQAPNKCPNSCAIIILPVSKFNLFKLETIA